MLHIPCRCRLRAWWSLRSPLFGTNGTRTRSIRSRPRLHWQHARGRRTEYSSARPTWSGRAVYGGGTWRTPRRVCNAGDHCYALRRCSAKRLGLGAGRRAPRYADRKRTRTLATKRVRARYESETRARWRRVNGMTATDGERGLQSRCHWLLGRPKRQPITFTCLAPPDRLHEVCSAPRVAQRAREHDRRRRTFSRTGGWTTHTHTHTSSVVTALARFPTRGTLAGMKMKIIITVVVIKFERYVTIKISHNTRVLRITTTTTTVITTAAVRVGGTIHNADATLRTPTGPPRDMVIIQRK
jgi:hypothetical protein